MKSNCDESLRCLRLTEMHFLHCLQKRSQFFKSLQTFNKYKNISANPRIWPDFPSKRANFFRVLPYNSEKYLHNVSSSASLTHNNTKLWSWPCGHHMCSTKVCVLSMCGWPHRRGTMPFVRVCLWCDHPNIIIAHITRIVVIAHAHTMWYNCYTK